MKSGQLKIIILVVDILICFFALEFAIWLVNSYSGSEYGTPIILFNLMIGNYEELTDDLKMYAILILPIILIFKNSGLYRMQNIFDSYYQFVVILKTQLISFSILFAALFILKHQYLMLRQEIVSSFFFILFFFSIWRLIALKYSLRFALTRKMIGGRVIIIGAGNKGMEIVKELKTLRGAYFTPIGFLDDNKDAGTLISEIKVLGSINSIASHVDRFDEILIALTNVSYNRLQEIIRYCRKIKKPIHVISDLYRIIPEKLEVEKFDGFSTFFIPPSVGLMELFYIFIKRLLDYSIAIFFLVMLLPFWMLIAVMIKVNSEGPVLYTAEVVGLYGKKFKWYKFRTMYSGSSDESHKQLVKEIALGLRNGEKLKNDARITSPGKWLRKYSIDEFPQLLNVIKGDMSLVGPRPVLPYEYKLLDEWQKDRFSVLPGLTGLWQIRGRNKVNFEDQHVLDLYYARNRSLLMDITILFNTVSVVLSGRTGI